MTPSERDRRRAEEILPPDRFYGSLWAEARERVAQALANERHDFERRLSNIASEMRGDYDRELADAIRRDGETA